MWYIYAIFFLYVWPWYSIVNIGNVYVLYGGYNVYTLQHKSIDVNIRICFRVFTGGGYPTRYSSIIRTTVYMRTPSNP